MKNSASVFFPLLILTTAFAGVFISDEIALKKKSKEQQLVKVVDESAVSLPKVNDYVIKFSGDIYKAEQTNADIELHGGSPSFNKGFKISVPSEYRFSGTEIKLNMREDHSAPKHYVLAQLYKNGELIFEQDNETLFKEICLLDLNTGNK
jgi:hypothetical protein